MAVLVTSRLAFLSIVSRRVSVSPGITDTGRSARGTATPRSPARAAPVPRLRPVVRRQKPPKSPFPTRSVVLLQKVYPVAAFNIRKRVKNLAKAAHLGQRRHSARAQPARRAGHTGGVDAHNLPYRFSLPAANESGGGSGGQNVWQGRPRVLRGTDTSAPVKRRVFPGGCSCPGDAPGGPGSSQSNSPPSG